MQQHEIHGCNPISRPHKKCQKKRLQSGRADHKMYFTLVQWLGSEKQVMLGDFHSDQSVKMTKPMTKNQTTNTHRIWFMGIGFVRLELDASFLVRRARLQRANYEMFSRKTKVVRATHTTQATSHLLQLAKKIKTFSACPNAELQSFSVQLTASS